MKIKPKNLDVLPLEVKYLVTTGNSLKTDRKETASSETPGRTNQTTQCYFTENPALDLDLF